MLQSRNNELLVAAQFPPDTRQQVRFLYRISDLMTRRLPRELRDEIYSYVCPEGLASKMSEHLCRYMISDSRCCVKTKDRYGEQVCGCEFTDLNRENMRIPLFVLGRVVGGVIAREIVQWAYENLRFEFNLSRITRFLESDIYHVGLTPGECRLRNVFTGTKMADGKELSTLSLKPQLLSLANMQVAKDLALQLNLVVELWHKPGFSVFHQCLQGIKDTLKRGGYVRAPHCLRTDASGMLDYTRLDWAVYIRQKRDEWMWSTRQRHRAWMDDMIDTDIRMLENMDD